MLSGKAAFLKKSTAETSAAILTEDPRSLTGESDGVPAELDRTIRRCLEKSPDARFQSSSDLAYNLRSISTDQAVPVMTDASPPAERKRNALWITGAFVIAAIAMIGVFFGGGLFDRSTSDIESGDIQSLAVLPLENMTGNPDQLYLVDGIHDALISELASIQALKVTSRTSVIAYRGTTESIPQIAGALNVDAVVEGSVSRDGDRIAVIVQLIDGRTDKHLWHKTFNRNLENVLQLRAEVTRAIADEIRVVVTPQEEAAMATAPVVNPEAYDHYLQGLHILKQNNPERTARAIESFQRSLDIDPGFAPAWGGLAVANFARGMWVGGNEDWRVILPEVERSARRALALDEREVNAHVALGGVDFAFNWRWEEAEQRYRLAIKIDPNHLLARIMLSNLLNWLGRLDEAEFQAREAMRLAPTSAFAVNELVFALQSQGRVDEAWELALRALELDPYFVQSLMFYAPDMVRRGRVEDGLAMADEALRLCPNSSVAVLFAADAYASAGRSERAEELIGELVARSKTEFIPPGDLFRCFLTMGNMPLALDYLEQAYEARDPRMVMTLLMSKVPALAAEPRFQEILRKMDFPEN